MAPLLQDIVRVVLIGSGATAVMDIWLALLKRMGVQSLNFAFTGRRVGHLFSGTFAHASIAKAQPIPRERMLGWLTHYSVGIAFTGLLVAVQGIGWMTRPSLLPALLVGVGSVLAPLFVMQPAMGSGLASSKTASPLRHCIRSAANHAVFGLGLYVSAVCLAWISGAAS